MKKKDIKNVADIPKMTKGKKKTTTPKTDTNDYEAAIELGFTELISK